MSLLEPTKVVFYHKLDDFVEYTQDQEWIGSGVFGEAKIDDGVIVGDGINFSGDTEVIAISTVSGEHLHMPPKDGIASIDGNSFIEIYCTGPTNPTQQSFVKVRVWEVDENGFVGSGGTEVELGERRNNLNQLFGVVHMTDGDCVAAYCLPQSSGFKNRVVRLSVSGDVITVLNDIQQDTHGLWRRISRLNDTKVVTTHRYLTGTNVGCQIVELDGSSDLSAGNNAQVTDFNPPSPVDCFSHQCALSDECVVVGYVTGHNGGSGFVAPGSVSGTTVTFPTGVYNGSGYFVSDGCRASNWNDAAALHLTPIDEEHFVVSYITGSTAPVATSKVGRVDGDTIILGDAQIWPDNIYGTYYIDVAKVSGKTLVFCGVEGVPAADDRLTASFGTVNTNDMTIEFGDQQTVTGVELDPIARPIAANLAKNKVLLGANDYSQDQSVLATITCFDPEEVLMVSPSGDVYPSGDNPNRITVAFWGKNPCLEDTEVLIERNHQIKLTSGSIAVGDAVWNNQDVIDILDGINDGDDHLVILDFDYKSVNNWGLSVSVDGGLWDVQGLQDSGSQAPIIGTDSGPLLHITNGESDPQWIDELVLWAGKYSIFTSREVANLYRLGQSGYPMDQYSAHYA